MLVSHKNFVSNLLAKISTIKTIIDDQNICLRVSIHYTMKHSFSDSTRNTVYKQNNLVRNFYIEIQVFDVLGGFFTNKSKKYTFAKNYHKP